MVVYQDATSVAKYILSDKARPTNMLYTLCKNSGRHASKHTQETFDARRPGEGRRATAASV